MILVYAALNMAAEAAEATVDYISRFGRRPRPERNALRKLNIVRMRMFRGWVLHADTGGILSLDRLASD
jgi:hypothetical protein